MKHAHPESSRQRYRRFVEDYRQRRLDDADDAPKPVATPAADDTAGRPADGAPRPNAAGPKRQRREHLREYLRWLWPHRGAVTVVFALALTAAGLQMIEPLFMRFIIDRVLLNTTMGVADRLQWLNLAGGAFLAVIVLSNVVSAAQGLPPADPERPRHADAPAGALHAAVAPAAAEPLGDEDWRHPVAPHRRRGHDNRVDADGDHLARHLRRCASSSRLGSCSR